MKNLIKILFICAVIFVFIFIAAYIFLSLQGKVIITKQFENLIHKKVNIDYVGLRFPLNVEIRNLDVPDLIKVDYIFISPSVTGLLTGNIILNELKLFGPQLVYEKTEGKTEAASGSIDTTIAKVSSQPKAAPKKEKPMHLIFKHLNIKNGKLDFVDRTVNDNGVKITIQDIDFNLTNLYFLPRSVITNFALKGKIPWQQGQQEGRIQAEGWLNIFKKDMQATLKIEDIDGLYLYPYYAAWVDLEKTRIEKTRLNLISNIHSLNDNLTADCHLELTDIVFKPLPQEEGEDKAQKIAATVLDIFRALNQKIELNFTIKTKMSNPKFGFNDVKDAFQNKLAEGLKKNQFTSEDILMFPTKVVGGTFKGATDLSKALIDGTFGVVKELKEAVEYAFKKEQKE